MFDVFGVYALCVLACLITVFLHHKVWTKKDKGEVRQIDQFFTWYILTPCSFIPLVNIALTIYLWSKRNK